MAHYFPLIVEGVRFFVNPTQLKLTTQTVQSEINTISGPVIQYWYPRITNLSIIGFAGGSRAYRELVNLRTNFFEKNKMVRLFYKTQMYRGIFTYFELSHLTEEHQRFRYQINLYLLDPFKYEDFAINETQQTPFTIGFLRNFTRAVNISADKLDERIHKWLYKTK
ncbi:MAG: hypothetical protein QXY18_00980 [Nitrososphaerota archaeon]